MLVADVMGKGLPAALLGAATKSHGLEALCHLLALSQNGHLPEPKDIVTLAHAAMVPHLMALERVVTLCDARLNVEHRRLALVDGGPTGVRHWQAQTGRGDLVYGDH